MFRHEVYCGVSPSMIIDTFERGSRYELGPLWRELYPDLMKLIEQGESLPDGRYPLAGGPENGGVTASVESYVPRTAEESRYEGHALMADIQAVLSGDEYLDMFPLRGGEEESLRDDARDLVFYAEKPAAACRVHLVPGMFALVFPGEAHMPCQKACGNSVKKLVVKIPADRLSSPRGM